MDIEREFTSPEVRANPYPFYARLRSMGPVIRTDGSFRPEAFLTRGPIYLLTRHEDIYNALRDPRFANDRSVMTGGLSAMNRWWVPRIFRTFQNTMIGKDGADHRRLRGLVSKAFTPAMIEGMTGRIQQLVGRMLEVAGKKRTSDLIADLALPLPLTVISEMLGVPAKERLEFRKAMVRLIEPLFTTGAARFIFELPTSLRLERILRRLVQLRREQPGDDLLTGLVRAEESGDRLNQEELVAMVFLLLLAGHETTVNLIASGTLALVEHRDQLQRLREHPELIESAVEELLRFTSPVTQIARFTREDVEIKGYQIPQGSTVMLLVASANFDEAAFEHPDQLDIARTPNRHVAFGYGAHFCLGAPLARLEGRIAFLDLVRRFPDMDLAVSREQLQWRRSVGLRALRALPMRLGPPPAVSARRPAQGAVHALAGAP